MHARVIHADILYYKRVDAKKINLMFASVDNVVVWKKMNFSIKHLKFKRMEVAHFLVSSFIHLFAIIIVGHNTCIIFFSLTIITNFE